MDTHQRKQRLTQARDQATDQPESVSVRDLLSWFDASKRGYKVVDRIRGELRDAGLKTEPDFASAHIDSPVRLVLLTMPGNDEPNAADEPDLQIRASSLASATRGVESVPPDAPIDVACSRMSLYDYSQLAVLSGPRSLKGYISWETIGGQRLIGEPAVVRDAMHPRPEVVELDEPLLPKLSTVAESNFVFVKARDNTLSGIITAADITEEFKSLTGPYLLMGEIERRLRRLIDSVCHPEELKGAVSDPDDQRTVEGAEDLTLGELTRLFERPQIWERLGWRLDQATFTGQLHNVREVRNALMHFAEEPPSRDERAMLESFAQFLTGLSRR